MNWLSSYQRHNSRWIRSEILCRIIIYVNNEKFLLYQYKYLIRSKLTKKVTNQLLSPFGLMQFVNSSAINQTQLLQSSSSCGWLIELSLIEKGTIAVPVIHLRVGFVRGSFPLPFICYEIAQIIVETEAFDWWHNVIEILTIQAANRLNQAAIPLCFR